MAAPAVLLLLSLAPQHLDTATFRDAATAAVIERARARHARQDSLLHDYRARVVTRLEAVFPGYTSDPARFPGVLG